MSAILDTSVVSELYDVNAEPAVVQRVNELGENAYLSVITIGELFRGTQLRESSPMCSGAWTGRPSRLDIAHPRRRTLQFG